MNIAAIPCCCYLFSNKNKYNKENAITRLIIHVHERRRRRSTRYGGSEPLHNMNWGFDQP